MDTKVVTSLGCLLGGNANNGANAGLAYVNSNNAVSNSNTNIGSRICYNKDIRMVRPCLLAKQHKTITALVGKPKKTRKSKAETK